MKKQFIPLFSLLILFTAFLTGCGLENVENETPKDIVKTTSTEKVQDQSNIHKFDNYDELKSFLKENENNNYSQNIRGIDKGGVMFESDRDMVETKSMAMPVMDMEGSQNVVPAPMTKEESGGSDDFSKTNVQVEGVDEADIIKTDGEYIYLVRDNDLFLIKSYPTDDSEIVSQIAFKSRPTNIYVNEDRLVIFGYDQEFAQTDMYRKFQRRSQYTFFKVFDITDKENPKQIKDLQFEGDYKDSRMVGDYVYFITSEYRYGYNGKDSVLPRVLEDSKILVNECGGLERCIEPDVYYFDVPYSGYNFTNIYVINIKDDSEQIKSDIYLLENSQNIFVSQNNMYITYTRRINEHEIEQKIVSDIVFPMLSTEDQEKIAKIEQSDDFILNKYEKQNKIEQIIENFGYSLDEDAQESLEKTFEKSMEKKMREISKKLEKTIVHKIEINKGSIEYKTKGEVSGHVLNQFSMNESNGYFTIATTKSAQWSRYLEDEEKESYSNLYVLDDSLKEVGSVEKLAPGERIFSVRFMQDRAYMVTFKQTDPLFVIDLSSPTNPTVLGELKIPGFSNYLHPYDNDTLIGIGRDATDTGRSKGVKISLFDVSDVENLKEIDTYTFDDNSNSEALCNHKAFLFSLEKNLLALPVRENSKFSNNDYLTKAYIFDISKDAIKLRGKISHEAVENNSDFEVINKEINRRYIKAPSHPRNYGLSIDRILYIGDYVYTASQSFLGIHDLGELEEVNMISLGEDKYIDSPDKPVIMPIMLKEGVVEGGQGEETIDIDDEV